MKMRYLLAFFVALAAVQSSFSRQTLTSRQQRLVGLAKSAIRAAVYGRPPPVPISKESPKAVFVTIEKGNQVLGCRGTLEVTEPTLEAAIVSAARSASQHDPRYKPITRSAIGDIQVSITVVERLEPISTVDDLKASEGLVLKSGNHTGVVLPYEGRDPVVRLKWAYAKAGIPQGSPARLERLIAERFRD